MKQLHFALKSDSLLFLLFVSLSINPSAWGASTYFPLMQNIPRQPEAMSLNGSGAFQIGGYHWNPAVLGLSNRYGLEILGAGSSQMRSVLGVFRFPTSYGNFAIGGVRDFETGTSRSFQALSLTYGRRFGRYYSLGLQLLTGGGMVELPQGDKTFVNAHGSFSFMARGPWKIGESWGIFQPGFFLMLRSVIWQSKESPFINQPVLSPGLFWGFYKSSILSANVLFSAPVNIQEELVAASAGIQLKASMFYFDLGYLHRTDIPALSGLSLGVGAALSVWPEKISLSFGWLPKMMHREEHYFSAGISATWGNIDNEGPEVQVKTSESVFSPNADGVKDTVLFSIDVSDASRIRSWSLSIRDMEGQVVKHFGQDPRVLSREISLIDIPANLFRAEEYMTIPKEIVWDGSGDAVSEGALFPAEGQEATQGKAKLPDGEYTWMIEVADQEGNRAKPVKGQMFIDTKPPVVQTSLRNRFVTPLASAGNPTLEVLVEKNCQPEDWLIWHVRSANTRTSFLSKRMRCQDVPDLIRVPSKDQEGIDLTEGMYLWEAEAVDAAGNRSQTKPELFQIIRSREYFTPLLSRTVFSPNGDSDSDTIDLIPLYSNQTALKEWKIGITRDYTDIREEKQRVFLLKEKWPVLYQGNGIPPKKIRIDGKGDNGQKLSHGAWSLFVYAKFESGTEIIGGPYSVFVDLQKPRLSVEAELSEFTPDGDNQNDVQTFSMSYQDDQPIRRYDLEIYEKIYADEFQEKDPSEYRPGEYKVRKKLFRKFSGLGRLPEKILWGGLSNDGFLVHSETDYYYRLRATDSVGNTATTPYSRFRTGLIFRALKEGKGFLLTLTGLEFDSENLLKESSFIVVRNVSRFLKSPEGEAYSVLIQGHTDSTGDDEKNLRKTEIRALALMNALLDYGVDASRLSYQGMGEIKPLVDNNTPYHRYLNRRFELILTPQ